MSPQASDRAQWAAALREAVTVAGYSVRSLAREFAGPDASDREVESQRRKINKWIDPKGTVYPSPAEAARLERALKVPAGRFTVRPPRRDRLGELEARLVELERLANEALPRLDQVAGRVDDLEKRVPAKRRPASPKARSR